ncbi:inositol monophophatase [cyanobacterium endosymbiont of Rhopalodia gibberula]|uniref:inositol monophosphatase family protein n=1 Tax=cyanobacterium endosymbiont of Rhopalodia gibberula TaxID=1763363 RepID=UPI000DC73DE3|nr:inositol monophosphatase family protein [cyanobacterium endosymbiont of Rhopalodia gibberula]BBA80134.1 inositol monophophatase [cyanobacterium endosymbiont of Rhopalodia gibberula]
MHKPSQNELETLLEIATEAVMTAGVILQDLWGKLERIEEKGRPGDLVTEADKTAEAAILGILHRRVPQHQVLAEESGLLGVAKSDYLWVIDPLDGTTNYAHSYPIYAVSVGLLIEGIPQVGAIYDPFRKELFRAAKGLGSTLNYRPIRVSKTTELSNSLLVTGFPYDRQETQDTNYPEFCYLTHITQGVRRAGAAALDLANVACGRLDGYWERGLSPWDISAGIIILEEAGGKISAYDESTLIIESGRLLATNGHIHHVLSQALDEALPWLQNFYQVKPF